MIHRKGSSCVVNIYRNASCIARTLFMKLNDRLMLGFQKNQSSLQVILRSYQFMYTPRDLLKA